MKEYLCFKRCSSGRPIFAPTEKSPASWTSKNRVWIQKVPFKVAELFCPVQLDGKISLVYGAHTFHFTIFFFIV